MDIRGRNLRGKRFIRKSIPARTRLAETVVYTLDGSRDADCVLWSGFANNGQNPTRSEFVLPADNATVS